MKNRVQDLVESALNGQVVFHLALMTGTGFAANAAILPKIIEFGIDPKIAAMVAALVGVAAAIGIDGGFKKQLPYAVSVLFSKKDRATGVERKRGFNIVVVILVLITGGASLFFNWKVTPEITSSIILEPDGAEQTALSATIAEKYDKDVNRLEQAVNRAQTTLNEARSERDKAQAAAVAALGGKMERLVKQKHAWAIQQAQAAEQKAGRKYSRRISKAEAALQKAQDDLNEYISISGKEVTTTQASLIQSYENDKAEVKAAKGRWGSAFITFWVVSFVGFIGCTVIVVVYEDETGEDVTHNPTVFRVLHKMLVRAKDVCLAGVINKTGLGDQFVLPQLAGSSALSPTLPPTIVAPAPSPRSVQSERKSGEKSESQKKTACKVRKQEKSEFDSVKQSEPNSVQSESGPWIGDEVGQEGEAWENEAYESPNYPPRQEDGSAWPSPDSYDEWSAFTKRLRGWYVQAYEANSATTRHRNRQRVIAAISYIKKGLGGAVSCNSDERKLSIKV